VTSSIGKLEFDDRNLRASAFSRVLCSVAALIVSASPINIGQSIGVLAALLPLVTWLGLLASFWIFARFAMLPIFLVSLLAWGAIIQGRPDALPGTSAYAGAVYAAEFSGRLFVLGEIIILLWRSIPTHNLLPFVSSISRNRNLHVAIAVAVFSFNFLQLEVIRAVEAMRARGAIRGDGLLQKFAAIPLILSNLWVAALRQAIRRATIKWVPQDTLSRGWHLEDRYVTHNGHSLLIIVVASTLFLLALSSILQRN